MLKIVSLILIIFLSGCYEPTAQKIDHKITTLEAQKKRLEERIERARAEADKEKELALTKMRQRIEELALKRSKNEAQKAIELAKIKAQKELELTKIERELKLKELELRAKKEQLELENQKLIAQRELEVKKQFLYLALAALIFIIFAILLTLYFYKRRKDKLIAYHDNLEKYFRLKENEAKIAIANKIIDTIAEGKLTPDQEQRLLGVLKGEAPKELPKPDEPIEAEVEDGK